MVKHLPDGCRRRTRPIRSAGGPVDLGGRPARAALADPRRRLRRLERRRGLGDDRASRRWPPRSRPSSSPGSIPRSSTTSRSAGRRFASPRVRRGRSTGPRTSSTPPGRRVPSTTWCCSPGSSPTCAGEPSPSAIIDAAERLGVRDGGHPRRPARRRRPHPRDADHGPGLRPRAGRAPRSQPLELRGPDRDRRRAPRRLPRSGA